MNCVACQIEKHKIKSSVIHTCGRFGKGWKAPEVKILSNGVKWYKVIVIHLLYNSKKAVKYKIAAKQWVNGYKVKGNNNELWFPDHLHMPADMVNGPEEKCIWVEESHYKTLVFI